MFRCGFCGRSSRPRERPVAVVTRTRDKIYPHRRDANVVREPPLFPGRPGREVFRDDPGGRGYEIVEERKACGECASARVVWDDRLAA